MSDIVGSNIEMAVVVDVVVWIILYPGACGGCAGFWRRNPCHVFPVRQPGRVAGAQSPGHCDLPEWGLWVYLVSEVGAGYRVKESSEGAGVWPGDLVEYKGWRRRRSLIDTCCAPVPLTALNSLHAQVHLHTL